MSVSPKVANRGAIQTMALQEFMDFGYLAELNRQFLHPLGLALAIDPEDRTVAVWDAREDPEGWSFNSEVILQLSAKAGRVAEEFATRMAVRLEKLGYGVQPLDPVVGEPAPSPVVAEDVKSRFSGEVAPPFTPQGFTNLEREK